MPKKEGGIELLPSKIDSISPASRKSSDSDLDPLLIVGEGGGSGEDGRAQFSYLTTVAFSLNYIIGTGFLTIPWAFTRCGILLGNTAKIIPIYMF